MAYSRHYGIILEVQSLQSPRIDLVSHRTTVGHIIRTGARHVERGALGCPTNAPSTCGNLELFEQDEDHR